MLLLFVFFTVLASVRKKSKKFVASEVFDLDLLAFQKKKSSLLKSSQKKKVGQMLFQETLICQEKSFLRLLFCLLAETKRKQKKGFCLLKVLNFFFLPVVASAFVCFKLLATNVTFFLLLSKRKIASIFILGFGLSCQNGLENACPYSQKPKGKKAMAWHHCLVLFS